MRDSGVPMAAAPSNRPSGRFTTATPGADPAATRTAPVPCANCSGQPARAAICVYPAARSVGQDITPVLGSIATVSAITVPGSRTYDPEHSDASAGFTAASGSGLSISVEAPAGTGADSCVHSPAATAADATDTGDSAISNVTSPGEEYQTQVRCSTKKSCAIGRVQPIGRRRTVTRAPSSRPSSTGHAAGYDVSLIVILS